MNTFEFFSRELDSVLKSSAMAQVFFQEPQYVDGMVEFGHLQVFSGATRCCLVSDDWEYVVKFTHFEDSNGDGCEREITFYENACDDGVEQYFAEPRYAGKYEFNGMGYRARKVLRELNIDFSNETDKELVEDMRDEGIDEKEPIRICLYLYEYPKAKSANIWCYTPSNEVKSKVEKSNSPMARKNANVAALFVDRYGYEEFIRLSNFLEWNGINDLHGDNVGYVGDKLVVIDYAGFFEDD